MKTNYAMMLNINKYGKQIYRAIKARIGSNIYESGIKRCVRIRGRGGGGGIGSRMSIKFRECQMSETRDGELISSHIFFPLFFVLITIIIQCLVPFYTVITIIVTVAVIITIATPTPPSSSSAPPSSSM